MNRQRGIIAMVWLYLAGAIAVALALAALVTAWNAYTSKLDKRGYDRGVAETTAEFQKRDNAQLQAVVAAQLAAEARVAALQGAAAKSQAAASSKYQQGVMDEQLRTAALINSGQRLRDPGETGTGPACDPTGPTTTAPGTAGGNAGTGTELPATPAGLLSAEASEFLIRLTGEADDTARQLSAAQAVILSDRVLCNSP